MAEGDFHKERDIYIAERTNKAEIRPEEQGEKTESCQEDLWNEIQGTDFLRSGWDELETYT